MRFSALPQKLFQPVDPASLAFFRFSFGLAMLWEVIIYLVEDRIFGHWLMLRVHFPYWIVPNLEPMSPWAMNALFVILGICGLCITLGLFYRIACAIFFLGFTYAFLLEQSLYLNHQYLVCLLSFMMIFLPANRAYALDARIWPRLRQERIPYWGLFLVQFQFAVVYIGGAIAKINPDWLRGEPMRHWLAYKVELFPGVGHLLREEWVVYLMSYSGLIIDAVVVFLLVNRKTRPFILTIVVFFHLLNDRLFTISIFPWLMLLANPIFFEADWPKRFAHSLQNRKQSQAALIMLGAVLLALTSPFFHKSLGNLPFLVAFLTGGILVWTYLEAFSPFPLPQSEQKRPSGYFPTRKIVSLGVALWMAVQMIYPLWHYVIPGNASWTEEGHSFSWRMMLRSKQGKLAFFAHHPETQHRIPLEIDSLVTYWQLRDLNMEPYMMSQMAQELQQRLRAQGKTGYEIRAKALTSLNFRREPALLVDSTVDLSTVRYNPFWHNDWILLLDE
jgi:vitamin K-dependent gamma-carboxylase